MDKDLEIHDDLHESVEEVEEIAEESHDDGEHGFIKHRGKWVRK